VAGRSALRSGLLAALALTGLAAGVAPPAAASGPSAQSLAGRVTSGVVVDLDGDGSAEIVAVRPEAAAPMLGIEAWRERDGTWESLGVAPVLVADGPAAELRSARVGADAGSLLVASVDRSPRAVLASAPIDGDGLAACCLTLFDVALVDGVLELQVVGQGLGLATSVRALDLEADGTDELLVAGPVDPAGPAAPFDSVQLLRRIGPRYAADPVVYPERAGSLAAIGDSDGLPGDEVHFVTSGTITRMRWEGESLRTEAQPLNEMINVGAGGWVVGATGGVIVAVDGDRSLAVAAWPRDRRIAATGRVETGLFPSVFLLGAGPGARIVELTGGFPAEDRTLTVRVHDLALQREREIVAPDAFQALWDVAVLDVARVPEELSRARPAVGPIADRTGNVGAFLGAGALMELDELRRLTVHDVRPFAGDGAMGRAGTDAGWLVSGMGWNSLVPRVSYLIGGEPGTELSALPLAAMTAADDAVPALHFSGAAVADGPDGEMLYVSGDGFSLTVRAPRDSWVLGTAARSAAAGFAVDEPVRLELHPEADLGDVARFTATVVVLDSSGTIDVATWPAVLLAEPPTVRAAAASEPFAASATVSGAVSEGATVTVDGAVVPTGADGSFLATVPAPIWGRNVDVVARDALGRESTERLTAFGVVDVRGLPWLAIIGGVTAVIGATLFARTPGRRAVEASGAPGEGAVLEEIDADEASSHPLSRGGC
jgi:hypothetical protein